MSTTPDAPHSLDPTLELRDAVSLMMDAPERMALLDEAGRISAINPAWREIARASGGSVAATGRGVDYLGLCDAAAAEGEQDAAALAGALRSVMQRETALARVTFTWRRPDGREAEAVGTVRRVRGPLENWFLVSYADGRVDDREPLALPEVGIALAAGLSRDQVTAQLAGVASHVAILDSDGEIVEVNAAWSRFAREQGAPAATTGPGVNYLRVCEQSIRNGDRRGAQFSAGLRQVLDGRRRTWWLDCRVNVQGEARLYRGRASRVDTTDGRLVIVAHTDLAAAGALQAAA